MQILCKTQNKKEMSSGGQAVVVLTACQQSHPFEERRIPLKAGGEPVKIGRTVARLKATHDNSIFDCKVLSRNHAVLWYEEGRFYLKDTKSSNGTYVNNERLQLKETNGKPGEESYPKEVFSGDIIQFGVEIVENAKKITHGCIIALVRLFHGDGSEATGPEKSAVRVSDFMSMDTSMSQSLAPAPSSSAPPPSGGGVAALSASELFQLKLYIKEAAHREHILEQKLANLQHLLASTQEASESSWNALIDEDRLLSRIEMLEAKLLTYSKTPTDDKYKEEILALQAERELYETTAKESLRRALEEKVEAIQKLSDVERSLETTEEECGRLREKCESISTELEDVTRLHSNAVQNSKELTEKLQEADQKLQMMEMKAMESKTELERRINEMNKQESIHGAKVESLVAERDSAAEQVAALKLRVGGGEGMGREGVGASEGSDERFQQLSALLNEAEAEVLNYKTQLKETTQRLASEQRDLESVRGELKKTKDTMTENKKKAAQMDEAMRRSDEKLSEIVEKATADLRVHLEESFQQKDESNLLVQQLTEFSTVLERQLHSLLRAQTANGHLTSNGEVEIDADSNYDSALTSSVVSLDGTASVSGENGTSQEELLQELARFKDEVEHSRLVEKEQAEDIHSLQKKLQHMDVIVAQSSAEGQRAKDLLAKNNEEFERLVAERDSTKVNLTESEKLCQDNQVEIDGLRKKLQILTEELEFEKSLRSTSTMDNDKARVALHRQAAKNSAEFAGFKEECVKLRERIVAIENEMKTSRRENSRLSQENRQLQESCRKLELGQRGKSDGSDGYKFQMDSASVEAELIRNQLNDAQEECIEVKRKNLDMDREIRTLKRRLDDAGYDFDYEELALRARTITTVSLVPLLLLFLAIVMAFFPFFSRFTATNDDIPAIQEEQ